MKQRVIYLVIGIILSMLGMYQNCQYESLGKEITVVISDIETEIDDDEGPVSYQHTYYADYELEGKEYRHIKVDTSYTSDSLPDKHIGEELSMVINPGNPGRRMAEGGLFITVGYVLYIWNLVLVIRDYRAKERRVIAGSILIVLGNLLLKGVLMQVAVAMPVSELGMVMNCGVMGVGFMTLGFVLYRRYVKGFGWCIGLLAALGFMAQVLAERPLESDALIVLVPIIVGLVVQCYRKMLKKTEPDAHDR